MGNDYLYRRINNLENELRVANRTLQDKDKEIRELVNYISMLDNYIGTLGDGGPTVTATEIELRAEIEELKFSLFKNEWARDFMSIRLKNGKCAWGCFENEYCPEAQKEIRELKEALERYQDE